MEYVINRGRGWMKEAIREFLSGIGKHCQEMVVERDVFKLDDALKMWPFSSVWLEKDTKFIGLADEIESYCVIMSLAMMDIRKREASDWSVGIKQIENSVNERPLCAMSDNIRRISKRSWSQGSRHL